MSPLARPARAAAPAAALAVPVLLVVLPDVAAADRLPAAAEQARHDGAHLLIALARPRPGFTTDAAIAQRVAICADEELLLLRRVARRMLHGSGVDYDIVEMTYRDSRSPAKRERHTTAAINSLSRRRGAIPLPAPAIPAAGQPLAPTPSPTGRPPYVVAVLADSAEAVRVARAAGELATASGRPLAMVVPVPIPAPSFYVAPLEMVSDNFRISQDAAAIAGRVSPTLERLGLPARVFSAPYRTDGSAGRSDQNLATAVEDVTRRLQAAAVVLSAASPMLPHLSIPYGELHLIEPIAQDTLQVEARPIHAEDPVTGR